jgi:hypothetical protein
VNPSIGTRNWQNPGNAQNLDGQYATVSDTVGFGSQYLQGVSPSPIPTLAAQEVLSGVTLTVARYGEAANEFYDNVFALVLNGTVLSAVNKAAPGFWGTSLATVTYTWSAADLAAIGITQMSQINATFGAALAIVSVGLGNPYTAYVDQIAGSFITSFIPVPPQPGVTLNPTPQGGQTTPPTPGKRSTTQDVTFFDRAMPIEDETEEIPGDEPEAEPKQTMKLKPPKGFRDPVDRDELAKEIFRMIQAHEASMSSRLSEWEYVQKVYDNEAVPSSLEFLEDVEPYNMALMSTRVDGIVSYVCGGVTQATPYFILKSYGRSAERMSDAEKTLHYALEQAGFDRKTRDAGLIAGLKGRALMRLRYETLKEGFLPDEPEMLAQSDPLDFSTEPDPEVRYSGLVIDVFPAEQAVVYPAWCESVTEARLVGHAFYQSRRDMEQKQLGGLYFEDVELPPGTNEAVAPDLGHGQQEPGSVVDDQDDGGILCYDVLLKLRRPGADFDSRYRATLAFTSQRLLALEEYRLPTPWYFAPGFRYEPKKFWPHRSIGERMLEAQTVYNDAWTLAIFGSAAAAFTTVAVSGAISDAQVQKAGIGVFVHYKGTPEFTPIPVTFNGVGVKELIQGCEEVADSIGRISQNGLGQQLSGSDTATEASILQRNQTAGISEFQANWGTEMERLGMFGLQLLRANWNEFVRFHGEALPVQTELDMSGRWKVEANGKTPANAPMQQIQSLSALMTAAKKAGIPASPPTKSISTDGVLETFVDSLELNVSTSKLIVDQQQEQLGASANAPGTPPNPNFSQLLPLIAANLQGQVAPGGMGPAAAGVPGANGPVGPGAAIGGVVPPAGAGVVPGAVVQR